MYAPAVRVRIATKNKGVIDISEDLVEGQMTRRAGAPSTFMFALQNARRKYDGVFTPMDRIVVEMKRIRWVRVYSGYLNSVPLFSVWPRVITLTSTCTLKRLQHWYWDPTSAKAIELMSRGLNPGQTGQTDGGVKQKVIDLLTEVPKWPREAIHISQIPATWFEFARPIADEILADIAVTNYYSSLGSGATTNGSSVANGGMTQVPGATASWQQLPSSSGKISYFGLGADAPHGMALTGEKPHAPGTNPWFCAMRWPYAMMRHDNVVMIGGVPVAQAKSWWKNRKILVTHPGTNRAVVVRAADWGPGITSRAIDVSKAAYDALGAKTDDTVMIAFAPENAALGPVAQTSNTAQANASDTALPQLGQTGDVPWGPPADATQMQTFKLSNGMSLTVHKKVAKNFEGFCNELLATNYPMKIIGGFAPRKISGSSKWSNHAYGAAIDIDWFEYGNGFDYGTTCKLLDHFGQSHERIIALARKWGLGWGGEWDGRKDWMHFEAIGAPSSARYDGTPVDLGVADGSGNTVGSDPTQTAADILFKSLYGTQMTGAEQVAVGEVFHGPRALINDQPLLPYVANLLNGSMRTFSSAPNGDLIAWFPDYFGIWGTAARMNVRSIELLDFTVEWSDEMMVTHQYVVGGNRSFFDVTSGEITNDAEQQGMQVGRMLMTKGIATIDFPAIMKALLGVSPADADSMKFRDSIVRRFGARPNTAFSAQISDPQGGEAEFWLALFLFMQNWANQYTANIPMTFMPELYPGMLLTLPEYHFQAYVNEVTHQFRFGKGGGFTTTAKIAAPARTSKSAPSVFGLLPIAQPVGTIEEISPFVNTPKERVATGPGGSGGITS